MHDTRISGAQMRTTSASGAPMRRQNELGSPWKHHPARELVGASQPFLAGKTDYASIRHDQVTALMHTPIDVWTPIGVGMWVGAPRESRGLGYPHEARLLEEAAVDGTLLLMLDDHGLQSSVGISSAQVRRPQAIASRARAPIFR